MGDGEEQQLIQCSAHWNTQQLEGGARERGGARNMKLVCACVWEGGRMVLKYSINLSCMGIRADLNVERAWLKWSQPFV